MAIILKIFSPKPAYLEITSNPIYLGRNPNKTSFVINDGQCSSLHCEIKLVNHMAVIKDMGSSNGTFINDNIIKESSIYLDDEIRIGQTKLMLEQSKMTPEEIERHTSNVARKKTQMVDLGTIGFDKKPSISKAKMINPKEIEMAKAKNEQKDHTLIDKLKNIFKKD